MRVTGYDFSMQQNLLANTGVLEFILRTNKQLILLPNVITYQLHCDHFSKQYCGFCGDLTVFLHWTPVCCRHLKLRVLIAPNPDIVCRKKIHPDVLKLLRYLCSAACVNFIVYCARFRIVLNWFNAFWANLILPASSTSRGCKWIVF